MTKSRFLAGGTWLVFLWALGCDPEKEVPSDGDPETSSGGSGSPSSGGMGGDDATGGTPNSSGGGMGGDDPVGSGGVGQPGCLSEPNDLSVAGAPTLVSSVPESGASQVIDNAMSLTFSEPMNQATVEEALAGATSFEWNENGTTVEFEMDLPFQAAPKAFVLTLPTTIEDLECEALESQEIISFALAAKKTTTLELDPDLTGNAASGSEGSYSYLLAGDTSGNLQVFGGMTFLLGSLPSFESVLDVVSVRLKGQVTDVDGDPSAAALAGFLIDRVDFSERQYIDNPQSLEAAIAVLFSIGQSISPGTTFDVDVATSFVDAWSSGDEMLQFRVHSGTTDNDSVVDSFYLRRRADESDVIVADGVDDPDPDNIVRLEVTYFEN